MNNAVHEMRIKNMEASMSKLDPEEDCELYIEIIALIGTQYLNSILHRKNITPEQWDLLHSYKPALNENVNWAPVEVLPVFDFKLSDDLMVLFKNLNFMEDLRLEYLRGDTKWNPTHGKECVEKLQEIKDYASR